VKETNSMSLDGQLVLHYLVIKGIATPEAIADSAALGLETATRELRALVGRDHAVERSGRIRGFAPTEAGRQLHREILHHDDLRARAGQMEAWYGRFESVNAELKETCTAWQLRQGLTPNDHTDQTYDCAVVGQLAVIHGRAVCLLAELHSPRMDRYATRLGSALEAVQAGDRDRFTKPLNDSYHDTWMELHQDLLVSFDLRRTAADA
jgi:hypothetical protein